MKKNIFLFVLTFILFLIPFQVKAEICSEEEIKNLTSLKNKIEIKYTHLSETEASEQYQMVSDNMYVFNFYNVPKNLVIISPFDENRITNTTSEEFSNVLNTGWGFGGNTVEFPVYTTDNYSCFANLGTIKIRLAWYNKYSTTDECKGNSNFKYCKKYLNTKISEETFNKELNKYKANNNDNEENQKENDNNIFSFVKDNYVLIIGIVIILIIMTAVVITQKRKRRKLL